MKNILTFFLLIFFFSPSFALESGQKTDVNRDIRIVQDVSFLDYSSITRNTEQSWIVGRIKPGNRNGKISGVTRDLETGKLKQIPQAKVVKILEGKIDTIYALSGKGAKSDFEYRIEKPAFLADELIGTLSGLADKNLPYTQPNSFVGLLNQSDPKNPIDVLHLIPSTWENYIAQAVKFQYNNTSADFLVTQETSQLFLRKSNPFIRIDILRQIVRDPNRDMSQVIHLINSSEGYEQAILIYLTLILSPRANQPDLTKHLESMIATTNDWPKLKSLTLGIVSSYGKNIIGVRKSRHLVIQEETRQYRIKLLGKIQRKISDLAPKNDKDKIYIEALLYTK